MSGADAEALLILNAHGVGLKQRMYNLKNVFSTSRAPEFVRDPALKKMCAALVKAFPGSPASLENVPGYEMIERNASQYCLELEEYYYVFVECIEFKEIAYKLLADMSTNARSLSMDVNPQQMVGYMDLMVTYAQLHMLISSIPERKLIVSFYAKAYFRMTLKEEENHVAICNYMQEYENARERLISEYASISSLVGQALSTLQNSYMKLLNPDLMRDEGTINATTCSASLATPSQSQVVYDARYTEKFTNWILYGLLLCPNELSSANLFGLLRMALQHVAMLEIHRDELIVIHNEFHAVFAVFNGPSINLTKQKKFVAEAATAYVAEAGASHQRRREWVRQELETMYHLCVAHPSILCSKFQMIVAACALARDEVLWLVRHRRQSQLPPLKAKGKLKEEEYEDIRVVKLIAYVQRFKELLAAHRDDIRAYYHAYLQGTDLEQVQEALNEFSADCGLDEEPLAVFEDIIECLGNVTLDEDDPRYQRIKISWFRLQCVYCSHQAPFPATNQTFRHLALRLNLIHAHADIVERFDDIFRETCSLTTLFYHRDMFIEFYQASLGQPSDLAWDAHALVRACDQFPDDTSEFLPEERIHVGADSITLAQDMLKTLAGQVCGVCGKVAESALSLQNQVAPEQAAGLMRAQLQASAAGAGTNGDGDGDGEDNTPRADTRSMPGAESHMRARGQIANIITVYNSLQYLCSGFNDMDEFIVFDAVIAPRETLVEYVKQTFANIILRLLRQEGGMILRPSVLLSRVQGYTHAFSQIEQYVDCEIQSAIREVLVSHAFSLTLGKTQEQLDEGNYQMMLVDYVAKWYTEFILKRIVEGVCFSPLNGSFITPLTPGRTGPLAQHYVSEPEIRALVTLIGPYGVDALDHHLVNGLGRHVVVMKKILKANQAITEELVTNYHAEAPCLATLAKFQSLTQLIGSVIAIGNISFLRSMLRTQLREAVQSAVPFFANIVDVSVSQYGNVYAQRQELLAIDKLGKYAGLDLGVDHLLMSVCRQVMTDSDEVKLWARLPFILAACFSCTPFWGQPAARYNPDLEANANGGHAFATAAAVLITNFSLTLDSLRTQRQATPDRAVAISARLFIEVSSVVIQRLIKVEGKLANRELPSLFVLLDKFTQSSSFVTMETLDAYFPYPLMRAAYRQLYEPPTEPPREQTLDRDTPLDDPNFVR